jgi:hypothetical protein
MGESRGMAMFDPVLIGKDGDILDMLTSTAYARPRQWCVRMRSMQRGAGKSRFVTRFV